MILNRVFGSFCYVKGTLRPVVSGKTLRSAVSFLMMQHQPELKRDGFNDKCFSCCLHSFCIVSLSLFTIIEEESVIIITVKRIKRHNSLQCFFTTIFGAQTCRCRLLSAANNTGSSLANVLQFIKDPIHII